MSADPTCPICGGSGEVTYLDTTPRFSTALSPREITARCDCDDDEDLGEDDGSDYFRDLQWDREHEDRPDYADEEAA